LGILVEAIELCKAALSLGGVAQLLLLHDLVGHFGGLWLEAGALGLASKTLYPFAVDFIFDSFTVFY
jgi:hypothetical protein